jgi:hypothetical protein
MRLRRARLDRIILLMMLIIASGCSDPTDLARFLPPEVDGWRAVPPDGRYDGETLFEYIDGGAEVYRALNVRAVCARRYVKEHAPEIIADLYDMGTSRDAFGAYHHDLRDGPAAGLGQESEQDGETLALWKGRYYLSIMALDDTPGVRRAVRSLAARISEAITEEGSPPGLLRLLPEDGLIAGRVHYFHDHHSLGRYHAVAGDNLLGLSERTEGLLAAYRPEEAGPEGVARYALLLIGYPTAAEARAARDRFRERHQADTDARGVGRTGDGPWTAARAEGPLLIAVLDAPARDEAAGMLERVLGRQPGGGDGSPGGP